MFSTSIHHHHDLNKQTLWINLLLLIGTLCIFKNFILLLRWIFVAFFRPTKNLKKSYGSWAVITGCTDGIGKAFAFQLAQKGLNLILVGRNSEKLKEVSAAIRSETANRLMIKLVVVDFSSSSSDDDDGRRRRRSCCWVDEFEKAIKGLDIGILINNVGVTYPAARFFHEVEEEVWMNVVRVNLVGTTLVTKAVLPRMLEKKRGAIVNLGSGASIVVPSHPLYAIYAATKA